MNLSKLTKKYAMKYTVSKTVGSMTYKAKVWFDGSVYRWVSNDRVPPADAIREYGIDQLPNFWPGEHQLMREADLENFLREAYPEKKKRVTVKEQAQAQIQEAKSRVQKLVQTLPRHPMGHAFLWGVVEVTFKNGKTRQYKACLGGICVEDLDRAVRLAETVKGVSKVYYNLD